MNVAVIREQAARRNGQFTHSASQINGAGGYWHDQQARYRLKPGRSRRCGRPVLSLLASGDIEVLLMMRVVTLFRALGPNMHSSS